MKTTDTDLLTDLIADFDSDDFPTFIGPETQAAIRRLVEAVRAGKIHLRECRDCGLVFYATDNIRYADLSDLCDKCSSDNTRRIR